MSNPRYVGLLLGALLFFSVPAQAQELFCRVTVSHSQLGGSDFTFLSELQVQIAEYFNQRIWTEDRFRPEERIDCNINVTFLEAVTLTSFRARLVVSFSRPIYGTVQTRSVVQFNDENWRFDYTQGTPIVYDLDRYDPLSSVLDFYAYMILGYDYDTFDELGGTRYFEAARRVADLARSANAIGWNEIGNDQSRGALIAQLLEPRFQLLRRGYFQYYFRGLDRFVTQTEVARTEIYSVLENINELYEQVSRSYAIDLFFLSRPDELIAIFEDSPLAGQAYDLLTVLDPANLSTYSALIN